MTAAQQELRLRPKRWRPRLEYVRRLEWLVMDLKAERVRLLERIRELEAAKGGS